MIFISLSPFQSYIMDCYFRQSWVDKRLSFEGYEGALALSIEMLRKIWKPDTYGRYKDFLLAQYNNL